jgi:16S rRNA (cytidine1402-2'-O)-methyltransferase
MKGKLTLVPAPIDNVSKLTPEAFELLSSLDPVSDIVLIEDEKPARRRWINWGLDRSWIEHFIKFNEHTHSELVDELIGKLKSGKNIYMVSDCGLPAFCDPGRDLVEAAHSNGVQVTSTPFANSIVLALALSGFVHDQFWFQGFIPTSNPERQNTLKKLLKDRNTSILMDTPYRLKKLIPELKELESNSKVSRQYCLAMDLNKENEQIVVGNIDKLLKQCSEKKEFILIINKF